MEFELIDYLITKEKFSLQSWSDRYNKGVWVSLGLFNSQIDTVRNLSESGELDMEPSMNYIFSADWLPYVTGRTFNDAMLKLENRLATIPKNDLCRKCRWSNLVTKAISDLIDSTRDCSWYSDKKPRKLIGLPSTFDLAVKWLASSST